LQRLTEDFDNIRVAWHWAAIKQVRRELQVFCLHKSWHMEENMFYERTITILEQHRNAAGYSDRPAVSATEADLLLAVMRCHHSKTQAVLGIYNPTRQTMLDENLNILRAMGPAAYPELVEALAEATFPYRRRLIDSHAAQGCYSQEALTLSQSLGIVMVNGWPCGA